MALISLGSLAAAIFLGFFRKMKKWLPGQWAGSIRQLSERESQGGVRILD